MYRNFFALFMLFGISLFCLSCQNPSSSAVSASSCTIIYDANAATKGSVPRDSTSYQAGSTALVLGNSGLLEKPGYAFIGWNTEASGTGSSYSEGSKLAITGNLRLYAAWTANPSTAIYPPSSIDLASIPSSNASSYPRSLTNLSSTLRNLASDPVVEDFIQSLKTLNIPVSTGSSSTASSKVGLNLYLYLLSAENDLGNCLISMPINDSIYLSGSSLSNYLTVTGSISMAARATSSDGLALSSSGSNFQSASGESSILVHIDGNSLPTESAIKYFSFRSNTATALSAVRSVNNSSQMNPILFSKLASDVGDSSCLAFSFIDSSGMGGKVIVSFQTGGSYTDTSDPIDLNALSAKALIENNLVFTGTLTVYNDSNDPVFSYSWTGIKSFETDLASTLGISF